MHTLHRGSVVKKGVVKGGGRCTNLLQMRSVMKPGKDIEIPPYPDLTYIYGQLIGEFFLFFYSLL